MIDPTLVTVACAVYVALLLTLGVASRRRMRANTLSEFFLAGRTIGFLVLLMTLFATQYSGNSTTGFPGQTYRAGLSYFMSTSFMVGIVSGYLLFAPRLVKLARARRYLTPTDFLADRFRSPTLNYLSATILSVTLLNFLLAQLMALGHALAGLTAGRIPYASAVVGGAAVILVYECLGGMRAVAWTDAIQGLLLAVGLALVLALLFAEVGSPATVLAKAAAVAPEKIMNPSWRTCVTWWSTFLLLFLGGPLYPQAIQRLYAARRLGDLRRALATMAFLPLAAITTVVFIGVVGIALFPDLGRVGSDQVTFRVLAYLVDAHPLAAVPVLLVMMGVLAAIMSTADSALLSLSSIFTKDFVARLRGLDDARAEKLTKLAPVTSFLILLVLGAIALEPRLTLWRLLEIKFEILIQLSPAFVFGTLHARGDARGFEARDVLAGLSVGLAIALTLYAAGIQSLHGLHPGVLGVAANYLATLASRSLRTAGRR